MLPLKAAACSGLIWSLVHRRRRLDGGGTVRSSRRFADAARPGSVRFEAYSQKPFF